jgi:hypothetical protein
MGFKKVRTSEDVLTLSPSETTALLLELARRQAERRRPADILKQFTRDGFVEPSALNQRTIHHLDALALETASEFEALQLSPVAPLGSCSVMAPTSQDRTLTTARGTEVVSDPTNVLALECARRLTRQPDTHVRLCTIHQVLRAQPLPPNAGFSRHFRLFALAEAGRGRAEDGFEVEAIAHHVGVFDRLFDAAAQLGCAFPNRRATIYATARTATLAARVRQRLTATLPSLAINDDALESPYYAGIRVLFGATAQAGEFIPIADTGAFDWVARLTSNRRLRFIASGLGIQLMPTLFRSDSS